MPNDDGFGLDNYQPSLPIRPEKGENDPERPVSVLQAQGFRISFKHVELVAKCKVLQAQRAVRLHAGENRAQDE